MIRVVVALIGLISWSASFSQTYIPLLGQLNEWKFTTCYFGCPTTTYYTDGDTLVNGEVYKILDGYHYISRTFLLHEDIATQQIKMVKFGDGQFNTYLLYDFSLQEGDSIAMENPVSPFPAHDGYFTVDSIRSRLLVDGIQHRFFYFSRSASNSGPNTHPIWVEGVGSLSLINAPSGQPDINDAGTVSCFFKDNNLIYSNLDSIQGCVADHYLSTPINHKIEITVAPNPTTGNILIDGVQADAIVNLYDTQGVSCAAWKLTFHDKGAEMNIENLPSGIYFLHLRAGNESRVIKIEKLN